MKQTNSIFIFLIVFTSMLFAQSEQQFAEIGDLQLTSGQALLDCKIGYRTFGELNSDSSNIVIFPTWFAGTSEHVSSLIGPKHIANEYGAKKLVDDSKYFVIAIDALANGVSTSPSNPELQAGKDFPEISIDDMVNSQYKMLTENFGFKHIHAIIGGSMGSMQALQWIVSYPDFISKAIPYVASPRRSTYDMLIMQFRKRMIESYQELGADDALINVMLNYTTQLFVRSPEYIIENISHDEFESYVDKKIENREPLKTFTIENHLAQLKAMMSYNIYKDFNNSVEETTKHIKTEVFLILGENDMLLHPKPALELANELNCKVLMLENNCGHLGIGCELEKCGNEIYRFLNDKRESECAQQRRILYSSINHRPLTKNIEPKKPLSEIQEEFITSVDSTFFNKTIFIRIVVDTTGNVLCSELINGNNNYIDTLAIEYVKTLEFFPAEKSIPYGKLSTEQRPQVRRNSRPIRGISTIKVVSEATIRLSPKEKN
ncbi:MAG: alpha/beta fold hydrolase [Melioribacteraceae bacterium]|jgi:homoserine O-acetyltransferase|nr:alpha/beta fold hydrolase [Melioribacteraceae bacterium]